MSSNMPENITTISDLPDEILVQIFLKVPFSTTPGKSFVSLRAVCKRWAGVIDSSWSQIKGITFNDGSPLIVNRSQDAQGAKNGLCVYTSNAAMTKRIAGELIKLCGPHLIELIAIDRSESITALILPLVGQYCTKLEVYHGDVWTQSNGKLLGDLLEACTKLKILNISIHNGRVLNYFKKIPANLECLIMTTDPDGKHTDDRRLMEYIKGTIRKCQALIQLRIDYVDFELLNWIGNLQELQIGHSDGVIMLHDKFLIHMSQTCLQLEKLILLLCFTVKDKGIAALSSLPHLKTLYLLMLPEVTGKSLKNFSKLDDLGVSGCPVSDGSAIGLLKECHGLRHLRLSNTNITNNFLTFAIRETKRRTNNVILTIYCQNTKARPEQLRETSPLLKIVC